MACRIQPIHGLKSFDILQDGVASGILYPPASFGDGWEVWRLARGEGRIPGLSGDEWFRTFATKADALAFLGIEREQVAA